MAERPDDIDHALLTVILRLVFLLYAEDRDLLPDSETFVRHYSLAGLHERLREDATLHSDTMNQRYGAWAQLLVLFRLFHADADDLRLRPAPWAYDSSAQRRRWSPALRASRSWGGCRSSRPG